MDDIPNEVLTIIFNELSIRDFMSIVIINNKFYTLITNFNWKEYLMLLGINFEYSIERFLTEYGKYMIKSEISDFLWYYRYDRLIKFHYNHPDAIVFFILDSDVFHCRDRITFILETKNITRERYRRNVGWSTMDEYISHESIDIQFKKIISKYNVCNIYGSINGHMDDIHINNW